MVLKAAQLGGGFRVVCRNSQGKAAECQALLKTGAGLGTLKENGTAEGETGDLQVQILLLVLMQSF